MKLTSGQGLALRTALAVTSFADGGGPQEAPNIPKAPPQHAQQAQKAETDPVNISKPAVVTNAVSDKPLDDKDKRFKDSPLGKALTKDMPIKLGQDGYPILDQASLKKLVEVIEKNPEGIGSGFGIEGGSNVKVKAAIYFHGDKSPEQLKGTTLLFLDNEVKFGKPNNETIVNGLVGRHYVKRNKEDGKETQSQQVRLSNKGKIGAGDIKVDESGTVTAPLTFSYNFIGANPPTKYTVTVDPEAKETSVSKPVEEKDGTGKVTANRIDIDIPADTATIYLPSKK